MHLVGLLIYTLQYDACCIQHQISKLLLEILCILCGTLLMLFFHVFFPTSTCRLIDILEGFMNSVEVNSIYYRSRWSCFSEAQVWTARLDRCRHRCSSLVFVVCLKGSDPCDGLDLSFRRLLLGLCVTVCHQKL